MKLGILARPPKSAPAQAGGCLEPTFQIYIYFLFFNLFSNRLSCCLRGSEVYTCTLDEDKVSPSTGGRKDDGRKF